MLSLLAVMGKLGSIGHYQIPKGYELVGKSEQEHRCINPREENNSMNRNYEHIQEKKSSLVAFGLKLQLFYCGAWMHLDWNQESRRNGSPSACFPWTTLDVAVTSIWPDWHCLNGQERGGNEVQSCWYIREGCWSKHCLSQRSKERKVTSFWFQFLSLLNG